MPTEESNSPAKFAPQGWRHIEIAAPCQVSWDSMTGDDKSRFCGQCRLNVYNFSAMSDIEIEALWQSKGTNMCVQFYRRDDGTILTDNCPIGLKHLRKLRDTARSAWRAAATFLSLAISCTAALAGAPKTGSKDTDACKKGQAYPCKPHDPAASKTPEPLMGKPVAPPLSQPENPVFTRGRIRMLSPEERKANLMRACQQSLLKQLASVPIKQSSRDKMVIQVEMDRHGKVMSGKTLVSSGNQDDDNAVIDKALSLFLPAITGDILDRTFTITAPMKDSK